MPEETVRIFNDGDQVCALIGENIQEGFAGFGNTIGDALRDLAQDVDNHQWKQLHQ